MLLSLNSILNSMSFQTLLLVNCNIENMLSSYEDDILEKQSGNNADAVLNDFTDLEKEVPK